MKKVLISLAMTTLAGVAIYSTSAPETNVTSVKRPSTQVSNKWYTGNRAPLQPLHFIKLPTGSIHPQGWVRKYLELQRDGLTGQLGEISAWLEKKNNAWYSTDGKGDHGWEEVPYWLKGYGNLAYILNDPKMLAETKLWIDMMFKSQRADGYFGPVSKDDKGHMDIWANMLVLWIMQSWYEHSADPRVITFMTNYFHWQETVPDDQLLETYWENSRGGDNLYSIYWLYNRTGEAWLLKLADKMHRNTADWTQKDKLPNWHNVNIAQCFREPATYYMQTKDEAMLQATYNNFKLVRQLYGQVPGGMFGSDENCRPGYDDPRQGVETCGMVEQMASDEILAGITGDPFWADHCEDVAFNTYPAAVMPDFKGLRYITCPNMAVSDSRNHSPGIENKGPFLMMNPFSSRCCQHNHAQGWPYYAEHLWMATPDNGLVAMLYSSCEVTAKAGNGIHVTLKEKTNYPFEEKVTITVNVPKASRFPLYLRIPAWCGKASVKVNGKTVQAKADAAAYTRIERDWQNGDVIVLELPMELEQREWTANKNSVSLNYGPLTFSLQVQEEYRKMDSKASAIGDSKWQQTADPSKWPSYEIYPASNWNYGLALNDQPLAKQVKVIRRPWPADNFPFTQQSVPLQLKVKGKLLPNWKLDQYGLCDTLPMSPVSTASKAEELTLIPMGAARLRISAFPTVH